MVGHEKRQSSFAKGVTSKEFAEEVAKFIKQQLSIVDFQLSNDYQFSNFQLKFALKIGELGNLLEIGH